MSDTPAAPRWLIAGGVLLRQLTAADAAAMTAAVNDSLEHLRTFMRWAQQPADETKTALRLALSAEAMDAGGDAVYGLFLPDQTATVVGSAGLHHRSGVEAPNIGYWVHTAWTGRGIATRAAAALTHLAFEGWRARRVEIHCDVANGRSANVARRLGFDHVGTVDGGEGGAPGDAGMTMVWALPAADWPRSAAAAATLDLRIDPSWRSPRTC